MITIIYAPPRTGKTCLLSHILNTYAYDNNRNRLMQRELLKKKTLGFKIDCIPVHCVASNYDLQFKKFGYSRRCSRRINPYRLGFHNENVETHFSLPYEVIGITEAQKYLNSRMSMYFPDWQSRWYEQHGHNNIDVYLDVQRPMLIDVNIRELSRFIEVIKLDKYLDGFGKVGKMIWTVRIIDNSKLFDKYVSSGGLDKNCYEETKIIADYDVFSIYDSFSCKPKFYEGHFDESFDLQYSRTTSDTLEGYKQYLEEYDDECPKGFYKKRSVQ